MSEKDKAKENKVRTPFSVRFAMFMAFVLALVFLPTTIIFSVCMVPTLVALIVDNNREKTIWLTVGAMNLAGTVPVWCELWDAGHTIPAAFQLVFQPTTIMVAYGGATVGWAIHNYVTSFVASIIVIKNKGRLKEIDRRQREMVKKWGKEVLSG